MNRPLEEVYDFLTEVNEPQACKTLPAGYGHHVAKNFFPNVSNGSVSKLAEKIIRPGHTLPRILNFLEAPAALIGALVFIKDAGSLLPQLISSRFFLGGRQGFIPDDGALLPGGSGLGIHWSVFWTYSPMGIFRSHAARGNYFIIQTQVGLAGSEIDLVKTCYIIRQKSDGGQKMEKSSSHAWKIYSRGMQITLKNESIGI